MERNAVSCPGGGLFHALTARIAVAGICLFAVAASHAAPSAAPVVTAKPFASASKASSAGTLAEARPVLEKFQNSPAVFIENRGQWAGEGVRYALNGVGANVGVTSVGLRYQLFQRLPEPKVPTGSSRSPDSSDSSDSSDRSALRTTNGASHSAIHDARSTVKRLEFAVRFDGAQPAAPVGEGKSEQTFNYYVGNATRWRDNVPSWDGVVYRNLYKGIDLRVTGRRTGVKYEFICAPGADWRQIQARYEGVEGLAVRGDGALELRFAKDWPPLADAAPFIYQEIRGGRRPVAGHFALARKDVCGFEITGAYNPALPLIIDPSLEWSSYLGGSGLENAGGVAVDGSGNVYVTGRTASTGWMPDGLDSTYNGGAYDGFVFKLSLHGLLVWATYLGGSADDWGNGVALDDSGNVYVAGATGSPGWIAGGYDEAYGGGSADGFALKLSASGTCLWSAYLGGANDDAAGGIAVNGSNGVYVAGGTYSSGWVSGGFDTTFDGADDAFIVELTTAGAHVWSTYVGGASDDWGQGIALDAAGDVYVAGWTTSAGWVSGGFDTTVNGEDAFAVKVTSTGAHVWSTYLGGSLAESSGGIAVGDSGQVYVTGLTRSDDWVSSGSDTTYNGGDSDAFVIALSASGRELWSTYLGGGGRDIGLAIATFGSDRVYAAGYTTSSVWVSGGFDTTLNGPCDAFVAELTSSGAQVWSTYLGGADSDQVKGIAACGSDGVCVAGGSDSGGWVLGGYDTAHNGGVDAFVAKIGEAMTARIGSLCVTIEPQGARDAGARWRRANTATWRNSGETEDGIPDDSYPVEFNDIALWDTPSTQCATISTVLTTTLTATYVRQTGSLQVAIVPQGAIEAGAQWRRAGTPVWLGSGDTESGIPTGAWVVEFKDVAGWDSPSSRTVAILNQQTASTSGTYIRRTGSLQVAIEPQGARDAGARWRRAGTPAWFNGGDTENGIPTASYSVEFSSLVGWDSPSTQSVSINKDQTTTAAGTYVRQTGSLQVAIEPEGARDAGAGWRRVGTGPWFNSGETESGIVTGSYNVEFSSLVGWDAPSTQSVTINKDQTTTAAGTYVRQTGSLQVAIEPQGARDAGARWRRMGTLAWFNDGDIEDSIPIGSYSVEFSGVAGWDTPSNQDVTINKDQTTPATGTYVRQTGSLQVTIEPQGVRDAGAQWRRVGTSPWRSSGNVESGIPIGSHIIEFSIVAYWDTPSTQSVTINKNLTTLASGSYIRQTGSLQAAIEPQGARDAGAQWRRVGTSAWFNSGDTENSILTASYSVEFKGIGGWDTPLSRPVVILNQQMTETSGTYVRQTGSLQVAIEPQGARDAGAQWRRAGTSAWLNGGDTESGIPAGSYGVEFKEITRWDAPSAQYVTIYKDQTTSASGVYTRQTGLLQVAIEPQEARDAGAGWRRVGTFTWFNGGEAETSIPIGPYSVEFKDIAGWDAPSTQSVTIDKSQTSSASGIYIRQTGSLRVGIEPQEARDAGAGWRRMGTSAWFNGGDTESGVPTGSYSVEFKDAVAWERPMTQSVAISKDETTSIAVTYKIGCPPQAPPSVFDANLYYSVRYRGAGTLSQDWLTSGRVMIQGNTKGTLAIRRLKGQTQTPMLVSIESDGRLAKIYSEAPVNTVRVVGELVNYTGQATYARRVEAASVGAVTMEGRSTTDSRVFVTIASTQESSQTASVRIKGLTLLELSAPNQKASARVFTKKNREGIWLGAIGWFPECDEESKIVARDLRVLLVKGGDIQAGSIRSDRGPSTTIKAQALNLKGRRYGADIEAREVALGAAKSTVIAQGGNIPSGVFTAKGAILQFTAKAKLFPDGAYGGLIGSRAAGSTPPAYGALLAGGEAAEGVDVSSGASGASGQSCNISLIRGDAGIYGTFHTGPGACPGLGKIATMQTLKAGDKRLPGGMTQPTIQGCICISAQAKPPVLLGDTMAILEGRLKVNDCAAMAP